jgi:ABC-type sugar transport system ATPase subunit
MDTHTDADAHATPLLSVRRLSKSFGPVQALSEITLDVPAGTVTALVGDNGAGKSVLIKCIAGIHPPDAGRFYWNGKAVSIHNPRDAAALGIETVYQDLALCDNLNTIENMFLGRERVSGHVVLDEDSMELAASDAIHRMGITTLRSLRQRVGSLSGGQRQAVAIAKAVLWHANLVIFDEPTAALGVAQTEVVLGLIRRLADQGVAVIVISHNMNEVFRIADRIAVLHMGAIAGAYDINETDQHQVVELMTLGRTKATPETLAAVRQDLRPDRPEASESCSSAVAARR